MELPLSTILTQQAMEEYRRLFKFLWRLKRVEHAVGARWKAGILGVHRLGGVEIFSRILHVCYVGCSEMVHFVYQMQYYLLFEVLECSWDELKKQCLREQHLDLDQVIQAHAHYLHSMTTKALITPSSVGALGTGMEGNFGTWDHSIITMTTTSPSPASPTASASTMIHALENLFDLILKFSEKHVSCCYTLGEERVKGMKSQHGIFLINLLLFLLFLKRNVCIRWEPGRQEDWILVYTDGLPPQEK